MKDLQPLTSEQLSLRLADVRERLQRGPVWQHGDLDWLDMGTAPGPARIADELETQKIAWARTAQALISYAERFGYGSESN